MVGLAILIAAMFMIPLTLRLSARATRRGNGNKRRLRWQGIQWDAAPRGEVDVLVARGLARQQAGDVPGALEAYDRALAVAPARSALVLNNRGCALLQIGEVERAIADLTEAVALDPQSGTAHCSLAEAYARAGDDAAALASLRQASAIDPRWREHARTAKEFESLRQSPEGAEWLAGS